MLKVRNIIEVLLFVLFTFLLSFLFLLNLPIFREPHGFLVMNELSGFSSNRFIFALLFGSVVVCGMLGVFMMNWIPSLSAGMVSNLWVTTFFLMWIDTMFSLSIQAQTLKYLALLGLGLLFLYLFFFTLNYLGFQNEKVLVSGEHQPGWDLVHYWLCGWMFFYFVISIFLILNSFKEPEFQLPLATGFWTLCFLNYFLLLFLRESSGKDINRFSRIGRALFALWFLSLLFVGMSEKWFH